MQDADLFLELAGIAGVFVGFAALIAVRSGGASTYFEVGYTRSVVSFGVLTVVAAIAPVTLGRYDLAEHQVWALSSALVMIGCVLIVAAMARTPEYRANWAAEIEATRTAQRSRWLSVVANAASLLYGLALLLSLMVIVLGLAPELEAALYFTVIVLILLAAGWILLALVFAQRRPETAVDRPAPAAAGSSSA